MQFYSRGNLSEATRLKQIQDKYIQKLYILFQNFGIPYKYPLNLPIEKHLQYSTSLICQTLNFRATSKLRVQQTIHNYLHLKYLLSQLTKAYELECDLLIEKKNNKNSS